MLYGVNTDAVLPHYSPTCLTCTLSPGGSPLGPAREVFGWVLCGSASGEASWEGAGQAVLGTASGGALLGRQRGEQREEQERVCQWAEVESASEEDWLGQQHSPLVLEERNQKKSVLPHVHITYTALTEVSLRSR